MTPVRCPPCSLSDLTYTEHESLHGWKEKFKFYSCYPVVGKLIRPKSDTVYTAETLKPLNGTQPVPEGYVDAPILIAIKDKVGAPTHYPLCTSCKFVVEPLYIVRPPYLHCDVADIGCSWRASQVYDMSFGGVDFYGPGKPYNFLAGKDGARALAKVRKLRAAPWSRNV
jgi:hypothetical protein